MRQTARQLPFGQRKKHKFMKRGFTYQQIIDYVKKHYHYAVQTCVIAAVLRELGYDMRRVPNSGTAQNPKMPTDRDRKAIKKAIECLTNKK